jgi:hypothetical protein
MPPLLQAAAIAVVTPDIAVPAARETSHLATAVATRAGQSAAGLATSAVILAATVTFSAVVAVAQRLAALQETGAIGCCNIVVVASPPGFEPVPDLSLASSQLANQMRLQVTVVFHDRNAAWQPAGNPFLAYSQAHRQALHCADSAVLHVMGNQLEALCVKAGQFFHPRQQRLPCLQFGDFGLKDRSQIWRLEPQRKGRGLFPFVGHIAPKSRANCMPSERNKLQKSTKSGTAAEDCSESSPSPQCLPAKIFFAIIGVVEQGRAMVCSYRPE